MLLHCGGSLEAVLKLVFTSKQLSPRFSSLARTQGLLFTEQSVEVPEGQEEFIRLVFLKHEPMSEYAGRLMQAPIAGFDPQSF